MLATDVLIGGRYRLGGLCGRGGVADVYRAEDSATGEPVAVKVLRTVTTTDVSRFEREARMLERLDHPAIVRLRDEGEHEGTPYLVLDLVEGQPLSSLLQERTLSEDEVAHLGETLAGALAHAHELGVVHRDVKPGNVLVDREGDARLTDFGIARLLDGDALATLTQTGSIVGTAAYLAPEQVRGETVTGAADVYSLALVLAEAASGSKAFEGAPSEVALARLDHSPRLPDVAPWMASTFAAMTAADPTARPSALQVQQAFAARSAPGEATSVMHPSGTATTVIPVAPIVRNEAAPAGIVVADPAIAAQRRTRTALALAAAAVLLLALVGYAIGGSNMLSPTRTGTSVPSTVPSTSTPSTAPASTTPTTAAPSAPAPKPPKGGDKKGKH